MHLSCIKSIVEEPEEASVPHKGRPFPPDPLAVKGETGRPFFIEAVVRDRDGWGKDPGPYLSGKGGLFLEDGFRREGRREGWKDVGHHFPVEDHRAGEAPDPAGQEGRDRLAGGSMARSDGIESAEEMGEIRLPAHLGVAPVLRNG